MLAEASQPLSWITRARYPVSRGLFQGWVLDVVFGRVFLRELVHDVDALAVRVIDPHEGLPLVRERVLRENRLDRTLRFAGSAVPSQNATRESKGVLAGDDRAERLRLVSLFALDAHDAPVHLTGRQIQPANRSAASAEICLDAGFLSRADDNVPGNHRRPLEPIERFVIDRPKAPRRCLDGIPVGGEPPVYEAGDVLGISVLRKDALQIDGCAHDSRPRVA